jgi:hypothetical protein
MGPFGRFVLPHEFYSGLVGMGLTEILVMSFSAGLTTQFKSNMCERTYQTWKNMVL